MPVPVFTAGETLDASEMNAVGLWRVTGCTATFAGGTAGSVSNGVITVGTNNTSIAVANAFSADYNNYMIIYNNGVGSTPAGITLQLTGSTTGYYSAWNGIIYTTVGANNGTDNNAAAWTAGAAYAEGAALNAQLINPFLSVRTGVYFSRVDFRTTGGSAVGSGFHNVQASYTGFTLALTGGNLTGGTIRVYGYRN